MDNLKNLKVVELCNDSYREINGGGWFDDAVNEIADAGIAFFQSFKAVWNSYGRE